MRKLMWFTIGFGMACGVGAWLLSGSILLWLGITAAVFAAAAGIISWNRKEFRPAVAVLIGTALGLMWYYAFDMSFLSSIKELDGVTTKAVFEAEDYSFETDYGCAFDAVATWEGKTCHVRVYLNELREIVPGDMVSGSFRFRYTHTDGEKDATYHRGDGILLLAYQRADAAVRASDAPWWRYPGVYIQHYLTSFLQEVFPADTAAFARALLLGDDTDIDYETETAFRVSGIRHIIAVSGLHVSILFSVIYFVTGKRPVLTALLGLPMLALFAAVVGFTPSVTRACLMHGLMMLAQLFRKEYDQATALSFAALVMLVVNPLVITSVSFQLSVGCMAGIFLFANRTKLWLLDDKRLGYSQGKSLKAKIVRAFAGSVSVSIGAISLTTPLSAMYFGAVSLVSAVSNLLLLWVVTIAFYGIAAVCLLGLAWRSAAVLLAGIVSWPIRFILEISALLAKLPLAAVYTRSAGITGWLILCYVLFALFLIVKNKRPLLLCCTAVVTLCAVLLYSWSLPLQDSVRMTVLDVGQGQSIILQNGRKTFVVDCGGDYAADAADIAAETLLSMGITRIDGLLLTHYDADHAGGASYLLSRINADALYLPAWEDENGIAQTISDYDRGTVCLIDLNTSIQWNGGKIQIFPSSIEDPGNESGLCVLFQAANCDILITGDRGTLGEKLLLQQTVLPELEVLVVGHHGSKYSTGEDLLAVTTPQIAVISVDKDNSYGHPAQEVLDRLTKYGCTIYRTDLDGTVVIRR